MSVISQNETSIGEGTILLVQFNESQGQLVLYSTLSYTHKGLKGYMHHLKCKLFHFIIPLSSHMLLR